ncbi:4-(cytidine 5'-diphospho)-2-C-methyl-D-erythritol kinase [uncultured Psychrobacter sp.]|uniref:4-(cytidine 5'-diphospho)-2-C-methyl-D-erythritol kinase n=1 Tax=uncultured Psychrobacter sp. TaxID=259303 RepID=UPI003457EA8C
MKLPKSNADSAIIRLSPAKINLFLHITGRRDDGYHNLQTVFRLLNWGDYLHFLPTEIVTLNDVLTPNSTHGQSANKLCRNLLTLTGTDNITDSIEDNLIFKAAKSLLSYVIDVKKLPEQLQQVSITLDKRLPMGAGLGGGSSNAATTLLTLNEIWQFNLNQEELIKVATTIGADVPIFVFGGDAIAMGIGEQLTPIELPDQHYLLLTPDAHVSTAELFAHPKLRRDIEPLVIETIQSQSKDYTQNLMAPYHNVFTPVVISLAPAVDKALHYLQRLETKALATARMTGSGSAVFLPLDNSVIGHKALLKRWTADAPCSACIVNSYS